MSLMKTLARVAAGVMLAKGVGGMMQQQQSRQQLPQGGRSRTTGGGILGDLMGQSQRGTSAGGAQGGFGDILGQVFGGGSGPQGGAGTGRRYGGPNTQGASGGLGGMLDQMTRSAGGQRSTSAAGGGGLGDIFGGLAGGAAAGGLGGVLGDLLGGGNGAAQQQQAGAQQGGLARHGAQDRNDASFGEVFNDAMVRQDEPEVAPTPEQNAVAGLMLKAMLQAAKSDGKIDDQEKQRLLGQVGDLDDAEKNFIREQMAAPVDAAGLAREVPKGLEEQVYLMSLMAIDFDNEREAQYLHALAEGMGLDQQKVNAIHQQVGVQNLYA